MTKTRVVIDGSTPEGRILVDGAVFCTLVAGAPERLISGAPASLRAQRDMARLRCVADALEAHVAKEEPLCAIG